MPNGFAVSSDPVRENSARRTGNDYHSVMLPLPMVEINVVEKASSENLNNIQVLPTPESPMSSNLNNRSYVFFAISLLLRVNEAPRGGKRVEPVEHD